MSTRGASPRSCESGVTVRMLQDSEAPYFEKKMTHQMLQRIERLVIPVDFIRTHGHMLETVLSLTGPNGHTRCVELIVRPPDIGKHESVQLCRLYLGLGWVEFVKENGFQTGDRVIFKLVANACFRVLVSTQSLQKNFQAVFKTPPHSEIVLSKYDKESGRKEFKPLHPKVSTNLQANTVVPKCEINVNPAEILPVQPGHFGAPENVKVDIIAVMKHPLLREVDYFKHPGLDSAVSSNSRFPRFISKLSKKSSCGNDQQLELPYRFAKEHGHKFQARVVLLGPNGCWRIVKLKVSPTGRNHGLRVQFRQG